MNKANFNILDVSPISHVKDYYIPAIFATGISDDHIKPHNSEQLCSAYAGSKNKVKFEGDHYTPHPNSFFETALNFFKVTLYLDTLLR